MKSASRHLPGFSLLELMIATVLGSILLLTASSLFMTFMIGNAKTNARRQMSAEGTQMLGTLEYHIRNAQSAGVGASSPLDTCDGVPRPYLTLNNLKNVKKSACFSGNGLYFFSDSHACSADASKKLNSDTVVLTGTQSFTCSKATNGKQTIKIDFTLGPNEDTSITAPFSTIVQLRNS